MRSLKNANEILMLANIVDLLFVIMPFFQQQIQLCETVKWK